MMTQDGICFDTLMHLFGYDNVWHDPLRAVIDTVHDFDGRACIETLEYIMCDAQDRWNIGNVGDAIAWLRRLSE